MDQLPFISQQSQKHHTSLLQNLSSAFAPNQSFIHHVDPCEDSSRTALGLEVRHLPSSISHPPSRTVACHRPRPSWSDESAFSFSAQPSFRAFLLSYAVAPSPCGMAVMNLSSLLNLLSIRDSSCRFSSPIHSTSFHSLMDSHALSHSNQSTVSSPPLCPSPYQSPSRLPSNQHQQPAPSSRNPLQPSQQSRPSLLPTAQPRPPPKSTRVLPA